jgi:hypothetical protein
MKRKTYYIVQTGPEMYLIQFDTLMAFGPGMENAAHLTIGEARRFMRHECLDDRPHRFPRIIKVTTEYKTITNRR